MWPVRSVYGNATSEPLSVGRRIHWIAADPFKVGVRVLITGPQGFERIVIFAPDEDPAVITERVRESIEE